MATAIDMLDALAPWDAAPYFQLIKQTAVTLGVGGATLLVAADPMRVALLFGAGGGGQVFIGIKANPAANEGISISQTIPAQLIKFAETGPLCQMAWYGQGGFGTVVTVIEIALSKWPMRKANGVKRVQANPPQSDQRGGNGRARRVGAG